MRRCVLAYDADCGPCTRFKRVVEFLDTYHRFLFLSLTQADSGGLLETVPNGRRHLSFHLIRPDGEVLSGADAIPDLVSLLPSGGLVSQMLVSAPGGLRATRFVYGIFSRLHDSGACSYTRLVEGVPTVLVIVLPVG